MPSRGLVGLMASSLAWTCLLISVCITDGSRLRQGQKQTASRMQMEREEELDDSAQLSTSQQTEEEAKPEDDFDFSAVEDQLLSLQQAGDIPGLGAYATKVRRSIDNKMQTVADSAKQRQKNLDIAWLELKRCKPKDVDDDAEGAMRGLPPMVNALNYCWSRLENLMTSQKFCLKKPTGKAEVAKNRWDKINSYPPKGYCHFNHNKTSDVRSHISILRDEYMRRLEVWQDAKKGWERLKSLPMPGTVPCDKIAAEIGAERSTCGYKQKVLEKAVCLVQRHKWACDDYHKCYEVKYKKWREADNKASGAGLQVVMNNYRSLLRLQCILNAFSEGDDWKQTLAHKVVACQQITVSDDQLFFLKPRRYPRQGETIPAPWRSCRDTAPNCLPGTALFQEKYFTHKSQQPHWQPFSEIDCKKTDNLTVAELIQT
eukprot:TRINITY_DN81692_c0_g1_i1.p1 TRINITY_DN81692_c0_g1~~TRINITY_DN81692_c0_g1_i1.p1  ORF type:complete len:429 (-),score=95.73 TRINITY_DN81692_c0_g1_i1:55-1341(-)